ncbi:MAG: hypothetical protein IT449_05590 [Phycisphaerales bacterium]|nr:hypothetical protein [Phycisphaerales bacterium]
MFRSAICAYSWDFSAKSLDDDLDRIRGEWGIRELALWVAAPPVSRLLTAGGGVRVEHAEGGCSFAPREEFYSRTRLRPAPARPHRAGPGLDSILSACRSRGIEARLLISASRAGRMVSNHEFAAVKPLSGEPSRHSLCLLNAEVRAFLEAMVEDLSTREGVASLELRDLVTREGDLWDRDARWRESLGDEQIGLAGLCACESCRRELARADVDVDCLIHSLQDSLERGGDETPSASLKPPALMASSALSHFARFAEFRAKSLAELAAALLRASACPLVLHQCGDADEVLQHAGLDARLLPARSLDLVDELPQPGEAPTGIMLNLHAVNWRPPRRLPTELVRLCNRAADAGYAGVTFHTLPELFPPLASAVRQAARYTRRHDAGSRSC